MTKAREENKDPLRWEYAVGAPGSVASTDYLRAPDTNAATYSQQAARYTDVEQHECGSAGREGTASGIL